MIEIDWRLVSEVAYFLLVGFVIYKVCKVWRSK